jgi:hypothetical protein
MPKLILRPTNLHWIKGDSDDPKDLCAHAGIEFRVGKDTLVSPNDGDWTVSAAALYLLRTLSEPHTKSSPVGDHLFPCCGFAMFDVEGQEDVLICGCPSGIDFQVIREGKEVVLIGPDSGARRLQWSDWRKAVCEFSDAVQSFYAASSPKQPFDEEDAKGFRKFMEEWKRRRVQAGDLR